MRSRMSESIVPCSAVLMSVAVKAMYRENRICVAWENVSRANGSSDTAYRLRTAGIDMVKINPFSSCSHPIKTRTYEVERTENTAQRTIMAVLMLFFLTNLKLVVENIMAMVPA